jgi:hypothetical protein
MARGSGVETANVENANVEIANAEIALTFVIQQGIGKLN